MKSKPHVIEEEAAAITLAIARIGANSPKDPKLVPRARRGSLALNLTTVAIESGVKRHRIVTNHPELAETLIDETKTRAQSKPLRQQLDAARKEKQEAEAKLARSQSYSYRLLERLSQQGVEVQQLKEKIELLEADAPEEHPLIGSGCVVGVPPVPVSTRGRKARRQA